MPTNTGSVTTRTRIAGRDRKILGYDMISLVVSTAGFIMSTSNIVLPGNSFTVQAYLHEVATGTVVQLAKSGNPTLTVNSGDIDVQFDEVLPAAFSRSVFPANGVYEIRYEAALSGAGNIPLVGFFSPPNTEAKNYDPASTTLTNLNGTGVLTFTGSAPTTPRGMSWILLGKFASGDPKVYGGIGDSILEFRDDTSNGLQSGNPNGLYTAFFDRAMYSNVSTLADPQPCINFGRSGSVVDLWSAGATYLNPYLKYANTFTGEYGTNSFVAASNNGNVSSVVAAERALCTQIRTNAAVSGGREVKILRTKLLCRTTGAWALADGSDQTVYGQWGAGGDVELFNAAMLADVGVAGRFDAYVDFDAEVRLGASGTDFYKWKQNGPSDGIHPLPTLHEAMAVKLRTALAAL